MTKENIDMIPELLQPNAADFRFDLAATLKSIVTVHTSIPEHALTAQLLGTQRSGHGVLINNTGLMLTIGYIVTEAESVWLIDSAGTAIQGHIVGYDQETGFGLVQAYGHIGDTSLELGTSSHLRSGQNMILAGSGGVGSSIKVTIEEIKEFAGYWEYLLDNALFTSPAHPSWGGAALIGEDGKLYGLGSLILQLEDTEGLEEATNMIIPIDLLPPILEDLMLYGKQNKPPKPWMGWYVQPTRNGLVVAGVSEGGPAFMAGLERGDHIIAVNKIAMLDLASLYRSVWSSGLAGVDIEVFYERASARQSCTVSTIDRNEMLVVASLH